MLHLALVVEFSLLNAAQCCIFFNVCVQHVCSYSQVHQIVTIVSRMSEGRGDTHFPLPLNCVMSPYGCAEEYHAFDSSSCAAIIRRCSFAKHIYHKPVAFTDERDGEKENPYSETKLKPK